MRTWDLFWYATGLAIGGAVATGGAFSVRVVPGCTPLQLGACARKNATSASASAMAASTARQPPHNEAPLGDEDATRRQQFVISNVAVVVQSKVVYGGDRNDGHVVDLDHEERVNHKRHSAA